MTKDIFDLLSQVSKSVNKTPLIIYRYQIGHMSREAKYGHKGIHKKS
jgi:hypothetical protein